MTTINLMLQAKEEGKVMLTIINFKTNFEEITEDIK